MNPQEQREKWYLSRFREAFPDFPKGEVQRGTPPAPDFLIKSDAGGTVGIEVTQLYQSETSGSSRRMQESEQMGVVAAARRQAEEAGVTPVDVAVYFAVHPPITKAARATVSSGIAKLVSKHLPMPEETVTLDNRSHGEFPDCIAGIRISRFSALTRHHWSVPAAGYVQSDFVEELQARIAEKANRHRVYRRASERCWLLVVADGFGPASLFEASSATRSHMYESPFECTFFLEAFSARWFELRTRSAGQRRAGAGDSADS